MGRLDRRVGALTRTRYHRRRVISIAIHLVVAASLAAAPAVSSVPPPRPVGVPAKKPPPARPIAVATTGVGALTLVTSLTLLGLGIHTMRLFPKGHTEGEAHAYVHNGKNLAIIGGSLASAGVALLTGGIVWIVRDRRRSRATLARR